MTLFLIIGALGLLLVVLSLIAGDAVEGLFAEPGDALSTPVVGAFLAALGFASSLILAATSAPPAVAAFGGLVVGAVMGGAALAITRSLVSTSTNTPLEGEDLIGAAGTVTTTIPEGGLGEVSVANHGQTFKLKAQANIAIRTGVPVVVTATTSSPSVVVRPVTE